MLMHRDLAPGQGRPPPHRFDLQDEVLKADRVIPIYRALELQGEDQVQIAARASHKGRAAPGRRNLKAAVEVIDIALA